MKRSANVDFWRFVGMMVIVLFHAGNLLYRPEAYHFSTGYIYVEFF